MRPSVSLAACCKPAEVVASEPVASFTASDDGADGVAEFGDRLLDPLAAARARVCDDLQMHGAGQRGVAQDRLADELDIGGDRRRREPIVPRDHVGHPAHDHAAGIEPHPRLHADRGVRARRILAVLHIGVVETAREQMPVMRQLQLMDADVMLGEGRRDLRNFRRDADERIDRRGKMRLENRPEPLEAHARLFVEPIGFQAGRQFGVHFVLGHRFPGRRRKRRWRAEHGPSCS